MLEALQTWILEGGDLRILLFFLVAQLFVATATFKVVLLGGSVGWKKLADEHWTEKARLIHNLRLTISIVPLVTGLVAAVFTSYLSNKFLMDSYPARIAYVVNGLITFLILLFQGTHHLLKLRGELVPWKQIIQSIATTTIIFLGHHLLALLIMSFLPAQFSLWSIALGLVAVGLSAWYQVRGSIFLLQLFGLTSPPTTKLINAVKRAEEITGIKSKQVMIFQWLYANALAQPFLRIVAFSNTAEEKLTEDQLAAICVHELEHLNESRGQKFFRVFQGVILIPLIWSIFYAFTYGVAPVVISAAAVLVMSNLFTRFSRRMEKKADALGSDNYQNQYTSALEKLYELNLIPAVIGNKYNTHPELYDRILEAGVQPDYPRPKPPAKAGQFLMFVGFLIAYLSSIAFLVIILLYQRQIYQAG